MVVLTSSDGVAFTVDRAIAERSVLLKNMLDDIGAGNDDGAEGAADEAAENQTPIPIPNVLSRVLKKVIDYCEHHKADPLPTAEEPDGYNLDDRARNRSDDIEEWDAEFINVEQELLFEIILAANYLDIKPLLDLGCKTVANMIKGKTPEEIRKTFNIDNDFTPEEEEQIRKENEWAEDR
ncbi:hypothetical protein RI367_002432 [Sorochytrium milnesiophthora]